MNVDIKKGKTNFVKWAKRWRGGLPIVFLGSILFFLAMIIGGRNLAAVGIAMMFIAAGLPYLKVAPKIYMSYYATLTVCAMLGVVATMNYAFCLILNFVVVFVITFVNGDHFIAKNHFMYGFIFIMPQMQPMHLIDLIRCGLACTACFLVMSAYAFFWKRKNRSPGSERYVEEGCRALAGSLLQPTEQVKELHGIVKDFCHQIYGDTAKQYGKLNVGQSWQYNSLLYLEQLDHLLKEELHYHPWEESPNKAYLQALGQVFESLSQDSERGRYQRLAEKIQVFLKEYTLDVQSVNADWQFILSSLADGFLREEQCYSKTVSIREGLKLKHKALRRNFNLHSGILRFALKASILITVCFAISYPMPFARSYWLPITAYSMLMVFHEDEKEGTAAKLAGTILGMFFFALVTEFIPGPSQIKMLVLLFLGFTLILSISDVKISMLIGTQMSIGSLFPSQMSISGALTARFVIVLAAAMIVWAGGQLIFRTERKDALRFHMKGLLYRYWVLVTELGQAIEHEGKEPSSNELLLAIQMYTDEIEALAPVAGEAGNEHLRRVILPSCRLFHVEMVHMLLICRGASLEGRTRDHFMSQIRFISDQLYAAIIGVAEDTSSSDREVSNPINPHYKGHLNHSRFHLHNVIQGLKTEQKR